jgi:hypothetical protein
MVRLHLMKTPWKKSKKLKDDDEVEERSNTILGDNTRKSFQRKIPLEQLSIRV